MANVVAFSEQPTRRHLIATCFISGEVNVDHLDKGLSARFLQWKDEFFWVPYWYKFSSQIETCTETFNCFFPCCFFFSLHIKLYGIWIYGSWFSFLILHFCIKNCKMELYRDFSWWTMPNFSYKIRAYLKNA